MSTPTYAVGDEVVIVQPPGGVPEYLGEPLVGTITKISEVSNSYCYRLEGNDYAWSPSWFRLATPSGEDALFAGLNRERLRRYWEEREDRESDHLDAILADWDAGRSSGKSFDLDRIVVACQGLGGTSSDGRRRAAQIVRAFMAEDAQHEDTTAKPGTCFVHIVFEPGGKLYKYRCTTAQYMAIRVGDQVQVDSPISGKTWVKVVGSSMSDDARYDWKPILGHRRRTADALAAGTALHESMARAVQETSRALRGVPVTGVLIDEMLDDYTNRTTQPTQESTTMIEIINTTFVDLGDGSGKRDISKMSDATVFEAIARTEQEIKRLDAIEHKPKALKAKIDALKQGIADLVTLVDSRDATKQ